MTEPTGHDGPIPEDTPAPGPPPPAYAPPAYAPPPYYPPPAYPPPAYPPPAYPPPAYAPVPQQYGFGGLPPPPPAGGMPVWNAPPGSPPPGGNKTPWVPIIVIGSVLVLLLGAVGIFVLTRSDSADGPTTPNLTTSRKATERERPTTPRTTPSRTSSPGVNDYDERLRAFIPPGYPSSACAPSNPPAPDALATFDCTESTQPGGPDIARYSLFADKDLLIRRFNDSIAENDETLRCPNFQKDSPADWNYQRDVDVVAGQVACGTYKGNADVMWTQYDDLVLADVQSNDLDDLHAWWLKYS